MWKQTLLILLSVLGIALQVWGFNTLYTASTHSSQLENHLNACHEKTIVSDLFFFPEEAPRTFFTKNCFEVISIEQAKTLTAFLEKNNSGEFILILSQNNSFRRMDNAVLGYLLTRYQVWTQPVIINAAPGMPIFIARCRKAQPAAR